MMVLISGYCIKTNDKLRASEMYHMPGKGPGGIDTFCACHDVLIAYDDPVGFIEMPEKENDE